MKTKSLGLILVLCFLSSGACFAQLYNATWKLDPAKSKLRRGQRNYWVMYEGTSFTWTKVTVYGRDAKGQEMHNEWTGYFDGKAYPVKGAPDEDARAYTLVNDHTLDFQSLKGGKVVARGHIVIAADGKSRTVTTWSRNSKGKKVTNVAAYERA